MRDFACREPERYYELAAPGSDRKDHSQEGKGRRRQFMWMVEMYGYVFGAAEAGIAKHVVRHDLMRYTGDVAVKPGPYIIHYGIDWHIKWKDGEGVQRECDTRSRPHTAADSAGGCSAAARGDCWRSGRAGCSPVAAV